MNLIRVHRHPFNMSTMPWMGSEEKKPDFLQKENVTNGHNSGMLYDHLQLWTLTHTISISYLNWVCQSRRKVKALWLPGFRLRAGIGNIAPQLDPRAISSTFRLWSPPSVIHFWMFLAVLESSHSNWLLPSSEEFRNSERLAWPFIQEVILHVTHVTI